MSKYEVSKYVKAFIESRKEPVDIDEDEDVVYPLVRAYHVKKVDFADSLEGVGTVKGVHDIDLAFQTSAAIRKIYFREGDLISKEDLIAELYDTELQYKVDYQHANFLAAESAFLTQMKKYQNTEALWRVGAVLKSKLDEAALEAHNASHKMKAAEVEWVSAKSELNKTKIVAPIDGVVGVVHMDEGEFFNATNAPKVITVMDINRVYVEVGIIERDIAKVAIGLEASLEADVMEGETFEGRVENLLPVIEGKSHTLTVRILVDNPQNILLPGMFMRANIRIFEVQNAIVLPIFCLHRNDSGGYYVYVIDEEDIIHIREVQVGYVASEYVQILSGLREGTFIVSEAQQELKEGLKVQIMEVEESELPLHGAGEADPSFLEEGATPDGSREESSEDEVA